MMRRIPVLLIILLMTRTISAAGSTEVSLRYSMRQNMVRIVLQAEKESLILKARIHSSYTLVRVEFPEDFELSAPEVPGYFEYNKKGRNLFLNIKGLKSIKLLRLKSPSRLVIDAYLRSDRVEESPGRKTPPEVKVPESRLSGDETGKKRDRLSIIVIDPGHGGHDLGIYTQTYSEKSLDLKVARSLRYKLRKARKKIFLSRIDDRYISLMKRILYARKKSPDLIVSLHMTTSNQVAIYTYPSKQLKNEERYMLRTSQAAYVEQSRLIAKEIGSAIMKGLNVSVFFRKLDLPILSYASSPAILIELPGAEFFDYSRKNIGLLANSIMEGILTYEKK